MSEERVLAFYAKADTDEELGKQLAHVEPGDGALDQVVKIAAEAGFEVTASEMISAERAALSYEELESVAGGVSNGSRSRSGPFSNNCIRASASGKAVSAIIEKTVETSPRRRL